jgi:hypothetical protein
MIKRLMSRENISGYPVNCGPILGAEELVQSKTNTVAFNQQENYTDGAPLLAGKVNANLYGESCVAWSARQSPPHGH